MVAVASRADSERPLPRVGAAPEVSDGAMPTIEEAGPGWPDETAESSFLAEARDRGELPASKASEDSVDDADPKSLPPLEELVQRIPANVRETLDDLFRARFTKVRRVPRKALKS